MVKDLSPIKLKRKQMKKYRHLLQKYPVSQLFLRENWANAKRFIIYAQSLHCVIRSYAWRKRTNRVVLVRRTRVFLFDPRLKRMIKRRKANVKQWSSNCVRYYKQMGQIKEYEETELYGEELSKQMKQQLELLKSNKRGISLIEDANKNVELRLDKAESDAVVQEKFVGDHAGTHDKQLENPMEIDQKIKEEPLQCDISITEQLVETGDSDEKEKKSIVPVYTPVDTASNTFVIQPSCKIEKSPKQSKDKAVGSKFLDMLMSKVRVKNFAKESNFSCSANNINGDIKPTIEPAGNLSLNEEGIEDFVGFDESSHQPGMLLTPLVPQSCKTIEGNGAFVSDALEAYMKKNNLRDTHSNDNEHLLEPMYQDGRVTAHSVPPHMDMPAVPGSLQKLRTVADRRHYLQRSKNQKMAIINNEANIYRELQRKQRQRKVKIAAMQQLQSLITQMPFTRQGWQAASYVATETDKYYYQVIRIDGEMVRLPGSQGNNVRREKRPHRSKLTAQELSTLKCSVQCVDAVVHKGLKVLPTHHCQIKGKVQRLNQHPLPAIFRPCPLSQKPFQKPLDDDTAALLLSGGSMAIVSMPTVQLDVKPQLGRPLDEIAKRYLQYILPHHDITREWAEFSVSTLQTSRNRMREAEAQAAAKSTKTGRRQSFTFVIPYLNDRNHILVRRVVDRSEQLDECFSGAQPPEKLREFDFLKQLPEKPDSIALDCADVIIDMINTVAISCSENSFITTDPDAASPAASNGTTDISPIQKEPIIVSKSPDVTEGETQPKAESKGSSRKSGLNKQQRLTKELRRLNATIIDAAAIAKDANKPCLKDHCQLGCVCESIASQLTAREHCGRAECVLECSCTGAELTRVMRVETDGRGISNEDAFNLRRQATARLAKMEKDFTSTLVLTDNETLLINETQSDKKRRCTKVPKRYEDFEESVENDEQRTLRSSKVITRSSSVKRTRGSSEGVNILLTNHPSCVRDTDFDKLKHCQVSLRRMPDVANLATFCMTHQLYKCFCGGLAVEGKPIVIEKEQAELPIPYYVPELATRAHYSFERPPEESKKRRKQIQPPKQPQLKFSQTQPVKHLQPQAKPISQPQVYSQPQPQQFSLLQSQKPAQSQTQKQQQLPKFQKLQQLPQSQKQTLPQPQKQTLPQPTKQAEKETKPQLLSTKQPDPQPKKVPQPQLNLQKSQMLDQKVQTLSQKPSNIGEPPVKRPLIKLLPKPLPVTAVIPSKAAVTATTAPKSPEPVPERAPEMDVVFNYYRSHPDVCRRVITIPRKCYIRLNRRRAASVLRQIARDETPETQKLLEKRVSSAISFYRAELDQQRRLEQRAPLPELPIIEVDDDSDESDSDPSTVATFVRQRSATDVSTTVEQSKGTKVSAQQAKESEPAGQQKQQQDNETAAKLDIQIPKISACYSLNANAMDIGLSASDAAVMSTHEDSNSVNSVSFRTSYNDVIKKMNIHVSKKMQDIDMALQRESKIIPAPNEDILCIIKWANFLAAFESNYVYIWDVKMKNNRFLAATITNMMPAVCGAIAVVNTHFSPDRSTLPLMAQMLLAGKRNENTKHLAVVMQGRQQYWQVKGFLRHMEENACTKPTPQTHPILTKKINVLCTLMVKQRIRDQQRHQRTASITNANPVETESSQSRKTPPPNPPTTTTVAVPVQVIVPVTVPVASSSRSVLAPGIALAKPPVPAPVPVATPATQTKTTTYAPSETPLRAGDIRSNIEFRKVVQMDVPELQMPEIHSHDHRWLVLNLFDDFSHIFVPAFRDTISSDRIHNVVRVANETKKVVKLQFFQNAPYDAFVTPLSKRKIYFGPLRLDMQPPVLVLLQSVDGKMMLREVYQRNHNIAVQRDKRTMAFWLLQINGQVHFDIDLTGNMGGCSTELNKSEQMISSNALALAGNVIADDDDTDCVIVINDDEEDEGSQALEKEEHKPSAEPVNKPSAEPVNKPSAEPVKPSTDPENPAASTNCINFTIQMLPNQGGGLHVTPTTPNTQSVVKDLNVSTLPVGFVPFIANVPATPDGSAPATQFLTPQVQLSQIAAPPGLVNIDLSPNQPPSAKKRRTPVQRSATTATTSSVVVGPKDPPPPKINKMLQTLLSNNSGSTQVDNESGLTITKMRNKDSILSETLVDTIKIGAKRKSEEPVAIANGQKKARQAHLPKLAPKTQLSVGRKSLPDKQPIATEPRLSLPLKGSVASKTPQPAKVPSVPALVPPTPAVIPTKLAAATAATADMNSTIAKRSKVGFLVAKNLPNFRAKVTNGKIFVVKLQGGELFSFKSCAAASAFLNRHLSRDECLKEHLPGQWKFVSLDDLEPPRRKQEPLATPIVIED